MGRNASRALTAAFVAASGLGCGGRIDESRPSSQGEVSTAAVLETGAAVGRAYVGTTNEFVLGNAPVVATFDLLGGAEVELEVVTRDASPLNFELWQVHVDATATLTDPVDASSGFALDSIQPDEDSRWLIAFPPAAQRTQVLVQMDCEGGIHGCTPQRQPGQSCSAGWSCDEGLECALPMGACEAVAAVGTCIVPPADCSGDQDGAVCGCDSRTYPSECAARASWVPIQGPGACSG